MVNMKNEVCDKNETESLVLRELKKKRERESTRAFMVGLQSIATFGVPAFGAFFLGWWLDSRFHTGRTVVFYLLAAAFIISWLLFYLHFRSFMRDFRKLENAIADERRKLV